MPMPPPAAVLDTPSLGSVLKPLTGYESMPPATSFCVEVMRHASIRLPAAPGALGCVWNVNAMPPLRSVSYVSVASATITAPVFGLVVVNCGSVLANFSATVYLFVVFIAPDTSSTPGIVCAMAVAPDPGSRNEYSGAGVLHRTPPDAMVTCAEPPAAENVSVSPLWL